MFLSRKKFIKISFYLIHSNYTKMNKHETPSIGHSALDFFVCPCTRSFCPIFMKRLMQHLLMIKKVTSNMKFLLLYFLIYNNNRHIHIHTRLNQQLKMWFSDSRPSKRVNSLKSPFTKCHPKTLLFPPYMGKRK